MSDTTSIEFDDLIEFQRFTERPTSFELREEIGSIKGSEIEMKLCRSLGGTVFFVGAKGVSVRLDCTPLIQRCARMLQSELSQAEDDQ